MMALIFVSVACSRLSFK